MELDVGMEKVGQSLVVSPFNGLKTPQYDINRSLHIH
jgi:hypothetical protein